MKIHVFVEFIERAAGFVELLLDGLETQLVRPRHATELRAYHLVPAVEYLQANRLRQRLMVETHEAISEVDVVLSPHGVWWHPSRGLNAIMSLTGHPSVSVPTGLRSNGQPFGVTLASHLYREGELLAVARLLHEAMGFHEERPPLFS